MSTLTSILGTDLISNAPSVLNANFDALNVDKAEIASPAFTGVPTAPTASVGTANTQVATTAFVANATAGALTTYITINPANGAITSGTRDLDSSIVSRMAYFNLPVGMTLNSISMEITSLLTQGSFRLGIFNTTGQTSTLSTIFPSVSSNGVQTKNLSSVILSAGSYYQALTPIDGTAIIRTTVTNVSGMASSVTGKKVFYGAQSVVGGALPTTFNPVTMPILEPHTPVIRLDN